MSDTDPFYLAASLLLHVLLLVLVLVLVLILVLVQIPSWGAPQVHAEDQTAFFFAAPVSGDGKLVWRMKVGYRGIALEFDGCDSLILVI
jgi:hypothetical protein